MCQYIVNSAVTLQVNRFVTESCCDKLRVQGTYYSGSNYGGLQGLQLNPGEVMRWQTDHSVIYRGFEICGNAALPPHPTGIPGAYTVSSGPCHTNSDGSCFYTPNYPSHYGNNQDCNIQVNLPTGLDVVAFDTESGYDRLTLHGTIYQGNGAGLQGVTMAAGETMQFHTDGSVLRSGFAICSGTLSTNSPTTVAPTTSPTTSSPTTATPTVSPSSAAPSVSPTKNPTSAPTESPTAHPTSQAPSESPTESPTLAPSAAPSAAPTLPLVKMVLNGTFEGLAVNFGKLADNFPLPTTIGESSPISTDASGTTEEEEALEDADFVVEPEAEASSVGPLPSFFLVACVAGVAMMAFVTFKKARRSPGGGGEERTRLVSGPATEGFTYSQA
jgi:hypothetical protein